MLPSKNLFSRKASNALALSVCRHTHTALHDMLCHGLSSTCGLTDLVHGEVQLHQQHTHLAGQVYIYSGVEHTEKTHHCNPPLLPLPSIQADRQTDIQTERQARRPPDTNSDKDRQTDRQTDRLTNKQTQGNQTDIHAYRQTYRQTGRQTGEIHMYFTKRACLVALLSTWSTSLGLYYYSKYNLVGLEHWLLQCALVVIW